MEVRTEVDAVAEQAREVRVDGGVVDRADLPELRLLARPQALLRGALVCEGRSAGGFGAVRQSTKKRGGTVAPSPLPQKWVTMQKELQNSPVCAPPV